MLIKGSVPYMCQQDTQRHSIPLWTPMITSNPSFRNKSLRARNKVAHVELFREGCKACAATCCDCNLWKSRTQNTNFFFCFPEKKARLGNNLLTAAFGKLLLLIQYWMYTQFIICKFLKLQPIDFIASTYLKVITATNLQRQC